MTFQKRLKIHACIEASPQQIDNQDTDCFVTVIFQTFFLVGIANLKAGSMAAWPKLNLFVLLAFSVSLSSSTKSIFQAKPSTRFFYAHI